VINRASFESLYNDHWEQVYAVCYNSIRDAEVAREMVQDVFKSLWERREELQLNNAEHYLIRAAKFKTFEYFRNKAIQQKAGELASIGCPHSSNCTEEKVLFNELCVRVNSVVDGLPCQCKRVYKMSREQGMLNREIASELMISERAVEMHISKALSSLRLKLAGL